MEDHFVETQFVIFGLVVETQKMVLDPDFVGGF